MVQRESVFQEIDILIPHHISRRARDRGSLTTYRKTPKTKQNTRITKPDKHNTWKEIIRPVSLIETNNITYENLNNILANQGAGWLSC